MKCSSPADNPFASPRDDTLERKSFLRKVFLIVFRWVPFWVLEIGCLETILCITHYWLCWQATSSQLSPSFHYCCCPCLTFLPSSLVRCFEILMHPPKKEGLQSCPQQREHCGYGWHRLHRGNKNRDNREGFRAAEDQWVSHMDAKFPKQPDKASFWSIGF